MQVYLVGGAVRDALLNRKVVERDYVVVGATPEEMLSQGFTQVGKDFPVFLELDILSFFNVLATLKKYFASFSAITPLELVMQKTGTKIC